MKEIYESNKNEISGCRLVLTRDYTKLQNRHRELSIEQEEMEPLLVSGNAKNHFLMVASSIPAAIGVVVTGFGILNVMNQMLAPILATPVNSAQVDVINRGLRALEDGSSFGFVGKSALATMIASFAPAISFALTKLVTGKKNKMAGEQEDIEEEIDVVESTARLITDLKKEKEDSSLSFAREFLTNVSLEQNSREFNIQLLSLMAKHRDAISINERQPFRSRKIQESYHELIETMEHASPKEGASSQFLNSSYVASLILEEKRRDKVREQQAENRRKGY